MEDAVQPKGPVRLRVVHNSLPRVLFDVYIYTLKAKKR